MIPQRQTFQKKTNKLSFVKINEIVPRQIFFEAPRSFENSRSNDHQSPHIKYCNVVEYSIAGMESSLEEVSHSKKDESENENEENDHLKK